MDFLTLKNRDLCSILFNANETDKTSNIIVQYLIKEYNINDYFVKTLSCRINKYFMPTFSTKWIIAFYSVNKFFSLQSNKNWLDRDFKIPLHTDFNKSRKQKKNFETCSVKTKRRRSEKLKVSLSNEEIEYAFSKCCELQVKKTLYQPL